MNFKNIIKKSKILSFVILLLLFCFNVNVCCSNSYINDDINIELPYSKNNNTEFKINYTDFDQYTSKEAFDEIINIGFQDSCNVFLLAIMPSCWEFKAGL